MLKVSQMINLDQERIIYRFIILSVCKDQKLSRIINNQVSLSIFLRYVSKSSLLPDGKAVIEWMEKNNLIEELAFTHIQLNIDRFKFLCNKAKIKYGDMSRKVTKAKKQQDKEKLVKLNKKINITDNKEKQKQDALIKIDALFSDLKQESETKLRDDRFLLP